MISSLIHLHVGTGIQHKHAIMQLNLASFSAIFRHCVQDVRAMITSSLPYTFFLRELLATEHFRTVLSDINREEATKRKKSRGVDKRVFLHTSCTSRHKLIENDPKSSSKIACSHPCARLGCVSLYIITLTGLEWTSHETPPKIDTFAGNCRQRKGWRDGGMEGERGGGGGDYAFDSVVFDVSQLYHVIIPPKTKGQTGI